MEYSQFSGNPWVDIVLDAQLNLIEIINPNQRVLFGNQYAADCIGHSMMKMVAETDSRNHRQIKNIEDAVYRARNEKRNVYVEYTSFQPANENAEVVAHVENLGDGRVCIHATEINRDDLQRARKRDIEVLDQSSHTILDGIYKYLPIGLEVYDRDGRLIDINQTEMQIMGINKQDVLGLSLFENPNITDDIKERLQSGKNAHFSVAYDFGKANDYFDTSVSNIHYFDVSISILNDAEGCLDKYLLIAQDVTEYTSLRKRYEHIHIQTDTILDSLPVGVEIYANDGTMIYLNATDCKIFGAEREAVLANAINIHNNPNLPDEVKAAVRNSVKVHTHFPYNFNKVSENDYYSTAYSSIRQIECNGHPVINADGEVENYVFIVQDVTESVMAQEELRQSKKKSELAMKAADIMLWEFDVKNRWFISENEPLNDFDKSKYLYVEDYVNAIRPEDRAIAEAIVEDMINGIDSSFNFETCAILPNNSELQYCTISGSPYEKDETGKVIRYVGSRKNNTELQKKKLLQDKILNAIPLPILIKDVNNNFEYVFCNDESKQMFDIKEGCTAYDVLDDIQVGKIYQTDMEVFVTGRPYTGNERIVLKDGRIYDTIVRKSIIYDGGERLLLAIRWDQGTQNELQRRTKVLSISMDALNAYMWFCDLSTQQMNYGEGFEKNGRDPERVNTLEKFGKCIHPDDQPSFFDTMNEVCKKENGEFAVEYRIDLSGNGDYEWWECRGTLETIIREDIPYKYMYGMDINIEAHKNIELTLLKNKEEMANLIRQNELVLNNTNSGLAYITKDYIVQWENISSSSASLSFEAYKKGEYCYKSAHNRTSPCENCVLQRAQGSHQMEQIKFCLNSKRAVEIFATPVYKDAENSEMDGIVIRVDDVTEREQMIAELKHAKLQAEQSDKLKSAFLANMSHEIRTPLNAIVGFSDLLMSSEEIEEREEYMQIINTNNELLLKLINDILDLSKIEAGAVDLKYERFDLSDYFNGLVSTMHNRVLNPVVRLIATNPYDSCYVSLDKNRFAQILTNYVTNSIKYTPKGFIEVGYEQMQDGIRLYVKDTGIGVHESKKEKVFHRFEKLDEFAQGTGLGLSICKAIAESMGGRVGFESEYGQGSVFWAELPCEVQMTIDENEKQQKATKDNEGILIGKDPGSQLSGKKKTILVAEDIPSNYQLVSALLSKEYELIHAVNGKEAVEIVKGQGIDLVLMDMKMPVMDGLTATTEIRKANIKIPIVALTAHAFDSDQLMALTVGCDEYLVKPLDKSKLMMILKKYC